MSSPMSSTSIPSQSYLDQLGLGQNHLEKFTDHISMNSSYSMQQNVMHHALNQIHGSAAPKSSMTEHLPFYQAPPVQHTQHLIQGSGDPEIWQQPEQQLPAAQPQQIERQRVGKEVLVARSQRPFLGRGNPRIHWSDELHARFVRAVFELGGVFSAKPKAILEKMNVTGMKIDQVKSHLQKYRTREGKKLTHQGIQNSVNSHSPQLSGQGSSTSRSTAPVNGKGLESFQADIGEYGKLLQSSKDLIYAPMGDYQDNVMQTPNYSQDLIYTPMGDQLDNVMQTPNYSQNLIYAPMGDYQDNVMQTPNYSQNLIYAPMGDQQDNVMQTPNYSENLIYAPMDDYQDNVMQTQNYFQNLLLAPMGDYEDNANGYNYFGL